MLCIAVVLLRRPKGLLYMGLIHHINQLVIKQQPVLAALYEAHIVPCADELCQFAFYRGRMASCDVADRGRRLLRIHAGCIWALSAGENATDSPTLRRPRRRHGGCTFPLALCPPKVWQQVRYILGPAMHWLQGGMRRQQRLELINIAGSSP